jgi:phosphatidylglycerophosphatase A
MIVDEGAMDDDEGDDEGVIADEMLAVAVAVAVVAVVVAEGSN